MRWLLLLPLSVITSLVVMCVISNLCRLLATNHLETPITLEMIYAAGTYAFVLTAMTMAPRRKLAVGVFLGLVSTFITQTTLELYTEVLPLASPQLPWYNLLACSMALLQHFIPGPGQRKLHRLWKEAELATDERKEAILHQIRARAGKYDILYHRASLALAEHLRLSNRLDAAEDTTQDIVRVIDLSGLPSSVLIPVKQQALHELARINYQRGNWSAADSYYMHALAISNSDHANAVVTAELLEEVKTRRRLQPPSSRDRADI